MACWASYFILPAMAFMGAFLAGSALRRALQTNGMALCLSAAFAALLFMTIEHHTKIRTNTICLYFESLNHCASWEVED